MTESPEPARYRRLALALLGFLGVGLLLAGSLSPALTRQDGSIVVFYLFAQLEGRVILALAGVSFVLIWVFRWYRALWLTGLAVLVMLAGALFRGQRQADLEAGRLGWGWLLLVMGVLFLFACAVLARGEQPWEEPAADESEPGPDDLEGRD